MSLDKCFICSLIQQESLSDVTEAKITSDMFIEDAKEAFEYIHEHFPKYGKMPDVETLEKHVGAEFREEIPEPFKYYMDLIKTRRKGNILNEGMNEAYKHLSDPTKMLPDPDAAADRLKTVLKEVSELNTESRDTGLVDLRETTDIRWEEYQKVKSMHGTVNGYPFPWPAMNEATMGLHPGELWFVVARIKTGKTWLELALADNFFKNKIPVLLVTMEMPISKISKRVDAVYAHLPYGDFQRGHLDVNQERKFGEKLNEWRDSSDVPYWVCGKGRVKTVADLELLIEELKPKVVLIDGIYLMRAGNSESKWDKVAAIADQLQELAIVQNIPIIGSSQFNRKVKRDKMDAGAEDIGFAYELAQNADGLVGMFQDEDMREGKEMYVRLLEHREGEPITINVNWDFATMDFSQKGVIDDFAAASAKDEEEERISY